MCMAYKVIEKTATQLEEHIVDGIKCHKKLYMKSERCLESVSHTKHFNNNKKKLCLQFLRVVMPCVMKQMEWLKIRAMNHNFMQF